MARCSLFWLMFLGLNLVTGDSDNECSRARRCTKGGPAIRFPFWLRDHHPPHCGHPDPAFGLSCDENHHTVLNMPRSAKLYVKKIHFISQGIEIYNPYDNNCFQRLILNNPDLNVSASPFQLGKCDTEFYTSHAFETEFVNYVFFNCSIGIDEQQFYDHDPVKYWYVPCLSTPGYYVVRAASRFTPISELPGCSGIGVTPVIPWFWILPPQYLVSKPCFHLKWAAPDCVTCEQQGRGCRFIKSINNTTATTETECFHLKSTGAKAKQLMIGAILGSFVLIVAAIGLYHIHGSYELKKKNEMKIKLFLEDYKSLKAARYSYADIKIITNKFNQELGKGAFGTVYKGKLASDILVAVKILTSDSTRNGEEFINEVASMGRIHHVNVARLVGFCADGPHRALVYEFLPNESLEKFIFSENESSKRAVLSLEKLQDIALGIAKGMEYLHHGCDQQILHFDIKPHNILLDHNFVPKISDFGLAKLCSKEKSVVTMTAARGTMGYIAPEVASRNFGKPSYKSDVYSYGMLLLEMVEGRKNKNIDNGVESPNQVYSQEWVYRRMDHGAELRNDIEEERQAKIAKKLAILALKCIQWQPIDRPSMKVVVQMLEGEGDNLTVPPNPFASTDQGARASRPQNPELEIIVEAE